MSERRVGRSPLGLAAAGAALFLAGIGLGLTLGEAGRPLQPAEGRGALSGALADVRDELGQLRRSAEGQRSRDLLTLPAEPLEPSAGPAPQVGPELAARLDRLDEQLAALTQLQRQALVLGAQTGSGSATSPRAEAPLADRRPWDMDARTFLATLKTYGYGGGFEHLTRNHLLWDGAALRQAYGEPDAINDQGDYEEWVYLLPEEGEQFDFHLVNGLVVEAH